jgi:hypothetical protein
MKLNEVEAQSFVPYKDLISLRNKIYEEWDENMKIHH